MSLVRHQNSFLWFHILQDSQSPEKKVLENKVKNLSSQIRKRKN